MRVSDYPEWFLQATGRQPYRYQERIATEGLPDVLRAVMGSGKTAALILGWLWRRVAIADESVRRNTPRRLVFALPMRTLVDQVEASVRDWLQNLGLEDQVALHVVMGGRRSDEHAWRMRADEPCIIIGTIDCLVSKALMRGYGVSRNLYPMDFALVTNGAHFVIDEVQLAPASTATMRQLHGFMRQYGTAEPVGLTCMSATVDERVLDTVDNPYSVDTAKVETVKSEDRVGQLARRLDATKTIHRLDADAKTKDARAIAQHGLSRHRPGTRTLVISNTVQGAVDIAKALHRLKPAAEVILVHSRFRPVERTKIADELRQTPAPEGPGSVLVSTQVVEAGVDIDAAVLVTEVSPWPSFCQRTGRCNRAGMLTAPADGEVWWYRASAGPYALEDLAQSEYVLDELEGESITGEQLLDKAQLIHPSDLALRILRRPDLVGLFDTAPDLSGNDIDVTPYIRDADQHDCQLAWISADTNRQLPPDLAAPPQAWRCPVPVRAAREFLNRESTIAWLFDVATNRWERVRQGTRIVPGQVVLVDANCGGYDPIYGFSPSYKHAVPTGPHLDGSTPPGAESDATADESGSVDQGEWFTLDQHLKETRDQAQAMLRSVAPGISEDLQQVVVAAAFLHDVGKAHPVWQEAIRGTAPSTPDPEILLAKSPGRGRLRFGGRQRFRHELVSALLLSHHAGDALRIAANVSASAQPLVTYLVAAHHGRVRMQARDAAQSLAVDEELLGLRSGEELAQTTILGQTVPPWRVDLTEFSFGSANSWTASALALRDELGPFRLAYLECMVRVADWRASGGLPTAGGAQ